MPKCELEVLVESDCNNNVVERKLIITDYIYHPGMAAQLRGAPEDCDPGESPWLEAIEAKWDDTGLPLTQEEYDLFLDILEEKCFEDVQGDQNG